MGGDRQTVNLRLRVLCPIYFSSALFIYLLPTTAIPALPFSVGGLKFYCILTMSTHKDG